MFMSRAHVCRAAAVSCALLLAIVHAGCDVERSPGRLNDAAGTPDSLTMAPDRTATVPDTLGAPAVGGASARVASDTLLLPTQLELEALAEALIVPVAGVSRANLRDTFTESRGTDRVHEAIDILAPRGTPVLSAVAGTLLRMFDSKPGGLMVYATDTSERFILLYGHLDSYAAGLSDGMPLSRGQVIGYVGTTGNAPPDTPHLHFGILSGRPAESWSEGVAVNPYDLLTRRPPP
jgi:peptidoglycan LD-endopeptidase LytH